METNKDLGNGIKNRLQEYNKAPDEMVWDKIEKELKKKRKKRFLFWLLLTGLSIFTIIFLLKSSVFDKNLKNSESINNTEQGNQKKLDTLKITINNINSKHLSNNKKEIKKSNETKVLIKSPLKQYNKSETLIKHNKTNSNKSILISSNKNNLITQYQEVNLNNNSNKKLNRTTAKNSFSLTKPNIVKEANLENLKKNNPKDSVAIKVNDKKRDSSTLEIAKQNNFERWSISPYASFDYFYSFNHPTTNNYYTNYGIKLAYYTTEYSSVRLGISRLTLNFNSENTNNLTQQISYYEIPIEFKRRIIKGKVNTSLIAGFSYLVNNKKNTNFNNINNLTTKINNISLNFGLGINTTIYKRIKLNLEPIFKYHIKNLENDLKSETFTISIIGGVEYRF